MRATPSVLYFNDPTCLLPLVQCYRRVGTLRAYIYIYICCQGLIHVESSKANREWSGMQHLFPPTTLLNEMLFLYYFLLVFDLVPSVLDHFYSASLYSFWFAAIGGQQTLVVITFSCPCYSCCFL